MIMRFLSYYFFLTLVFYIPDHLIAQDKNVDNLKSIEYYIENKLVSNTLFFYSEINEMELSVDFEENSVFLKVLTKEEDLAIEVNYLNNIFVDSTIYRFEDGLLKEKEVIYLPDLNRDLPNPLSKTEKYISLYDKQGEVTKRMFIDHFLGDTITTYYEVLKDGGLMVKKAVTDNPKYTRSGMNSNKYPSVTIDSFYYNSNQLVRSVSYSNDIFTNETRYKYNNDNQLVECFRSNKNSSTLDLYSNVKAKGKTKQLVVRRMETKEVVVEYQKVYIYDKNDLLLLEQQNDGKQKVSVRVLKYDRNNRLTVEKKYTYKNGKRRKLNSKKIYHYSS